jgi:hypothetical protein
MKTCPHSRNTKHTNNLFGAIKTPSREYRLVKKRKHSPDDDLIARNKLCMCQIGIDFSRATFAVVRVVLDCDPDFTKWQAKPF